MHGPTVSLRYRWFSQKRGVHCSTLYPFPYNTANKKCRGHLESRCPLQLVSTVGCYVHVIDSTVSITEMAMFRSEGYVTSK